MSSVITTILFPNNLNVHYYINNLYKQFLKINMTLSEVAFGVIFVCVCVCVTCILDHRPDGKEILRLQNG